MGDFFSKHSDLIVWTLGLVIIGAAAVLLIQLNGVIPNLPAVSNQLATNLGLQPPPPPAPTSVNFEIHRSSDGNSFYINWQNLPNGTVALNIYRGKSGTDPSTWTLWKTVGVSAKDLANGSAIIDLGKDTESGFSFNVQAVGVGTGDNGSSTDSGTVLWESSSTTPVINTPPPDDNPPAPPVPPEPPAPSSTPSTPSSTDNTPPSEPSSSNPGLGNDGGTPSSTPPPTGIPYYNPQVQVTAYGNAPGDFSVAHVNQSIQIAWQNMPAGVDTLVVARSASSTGPWNTIIIQHNPGTSGSYALGIVDASVNQPFYYELTALQADIVIATYGPAYLAGN